jgi:hypothetical protein
MQHEARFATFPLVLFLLFPCLVYEQVKTTDDLLVSVACRISDTADIVIEATIQLG